MHDDQRFAQGRGGAGIEGGVPLLEFVAKADHDDIGRADQRAGADGVHLRALSVAPERDLLFAENDGAAIVAGFMVGHGRGKLDRQPGGPRPGLDALAPIGVDLT